MAPRDNVEPDLWTCAFDGPGDITEENAAALLDKELPQEMEAIYIPDRISRKQHGLKVVANWLLEVYGASGVQKTDNVLAALSKAETPVLVWLRGETDSDEDQVTLTDAINDGVHVLDASQGFDDIDFDPADAKEPEDPPDEPEPVAPARTRATRSPRTTKAAKPTPAVTAVRKGRVAGVRPAAPHPASQSTGPNGEDELAGRRRGKPRVTAVSGTVTEDPGGLATDTPTSVEEDEAGVQGVDEQNAEGQYRTAEERNGYAALYGPELERYIDDRIGHGFHLASLAMQPKQQLGRPKADGSEPTAYLDKELTFVVKGGVASLRTRGKPVPGQETFTMTRRQAIEEGLVEG
jgi:hypothetical protein